MIKIRLKITIFNRIILYLDTLFSFLAIPTGIFLLIAFAKVQNIRINIRFLKFSNLISFMLYAISKVIGTITFFYPIQNTLCKLGSVLRNATTFPKSMSSLLLTIDSYLFLKNNRTIKTRKKLTIFIYASLIWGSALYKIIGEIFFYPFLYTYFCVRSNETVVIAWDFIVACIITLITIIVCIVLIVNLTKIKIDESNEVLKKSKKENIKQIISYCVGNIILTFHTTALVIDSN